MLRHESGNLKFGFITPFGACCHCRHSVPAPCRLTMPPQLFGLWPGPTARGSGGRNDRRGFRIWNRSRLHYLRVHAFRWLDDTRFYPIYR